MTKPEDLQKELEEFIHKKLGKNFQIFAKDMPIFGMKPQETTPVQEKSRGDSQKTFELSFELKPKDIKVYLDRFVIGQDEAKKALAIAVCDHYSQALSRLKGDSLEEYSKQNVLILGPTGVGKTYMIKQIAKLIGVPFVKADATRFSETGYMGANVDDLIKDLVNQADGNIEKAEYGIVYLDEADKLATAGNVYGRDVSGRGVQLGLLKLMEETEVDLRASHDPASQMQAFMEMQQKGRVDKQVVNTKHILFIVSGAFNGLEEIVEKRLHRSAIGFNAETKAANDTTALLQEAETEDFIQYGFEPEFVGRLPVRVACSSLDAEKLFHILKNSEGSIVRQYVQSFRAYGIDLSFSDDALLEIATLAAREKTGARSLMTICERLLRDFKFELPSTDIMELHVDKSLVAAPKTVLAALLQQESQSAKLQREKVTAIRLFEKDFAHKHGMTIKFDREACQLICQKVNGRQISIKSLCDELLQSYEHGLKLIQQNTGQNEFILTPAVVNEPKAELERMVKASYNILS